MRILSVIQPSELGPDFSLENGVWKVNFPVVVSGGSELSSDVNNALTQGTDSGLFLSSDLLNAYAMVQDNVSQKINLYRFPVGSVFSVETATLVSSVNLIDMTGIFDDVAIAGEVITFTDAENGVTLTLDTANLQRVASILGSNTVEVMSLNGTTTISAKIDPNPNNAIQVTEAGLFVPDNSGNIVGELQQTLAVVETGLCHAVGDSHLVMPQIELVDIAGNSIGYLTDMDNLPVSSITADGSHCSHWQPPMANNCRIGKVGVGFASDFLYDISLDGGQVNIVPVAWRILINDVDTNHFVYSGNINQLPIDYPTVNPELVMGVGYLEDVIAGASNGEIGAVWENGLTVWNKVSKQNIITLIPLKPLTLESFVNPYDELKPVLDIREFDQATLDEMVATNFLNVYNEYTHTLTVWANYFNASYVHNGETTGAVTICLAPNSTPPKIPEPVGSSYLELSSGEEFYGDWDVYIDDVLVGAITDKYTLKLLLEGGSHLVNLSIVTSGGVSGDTASTMLFVNNDALRTHTMKLVAKNSWHGLPHLMRYNDTARINVNNKGFKTLSVGFGKYDPMLPTSSSFILVNELEKAVVDSPVDDSGINLKLTVNGEVIEGFLAANQPETGYHDWDTIRLALSTRFPLLSIGIAVGLSGSSINGGSAIPEGATYSLYLDNLDPDNNVKVVIENINIVGIVDDINGVIPIGATILSEGSYEVNLRWFAE